VEQAKILLFNFIIIPHLILASSLQTGDAYSKSSIQINTDDENVVIQNNDVSAISNTGNNSPSESQSTGNATAVSEININNGNVDGKLEVGVNGEKKVQKVDKPGNYKLQIDKEGKATSTSELKTQQGPANPNTRQNSAKPVIVLYLERFFNFVLRLFKK